MKSYKIAILLFLLCFSPFELTHLSAQRYTKNAKGQIIDRRTGALGSGGSQYSHKNGPDKRTGLYRSANTGVHHFFGVWQDDSYSTFFHHIPNVSLTPGGGAISLGMCYEYQIDRLRFQVGAGLRGQSVKNYMSDTTIIRDYVHDTQGYNYRLKYDFRNREDKTRNLYVQVPLMIGYGFNNMYFMVGAKFQYAIAGNTCVLDTGVTTGTYSQYLGLYEEMDNHGLRKDVPYYNNRLPRLQLKADILVSAEIGYEWVWENKLNRNTSHTTKETRFRIAAFADYGVLNSNPNNNYDAIYVPEGPYQWDFPAFSRNHVFSTYLTQGKELHNFFAGIKLTVLIGVTVEYRCRLCTPFLSEADGL